MTPLNFFKELKNSLDTIVFASEMLKPWEKDRIQVFHKKEDGWKYYKIKPGKSIGATGDFVQDLTFKMFQNDLMKREIDKEKTIKHIFLLWGREGTL